MKCADVDLLLGEGIEPAEFRARPEVRGHMDTCPRCAALLSWSLAPLPVPREDERAAERIRAMLHADLKPVAPVPPVWVAAAGACCVAAIIGGLSAWGVGVRGWNALTGAQPLLLGALFLAAILAAAASLHESIRPGSRRRVAPLAPVALIAVGFPAIVASLFPFAPTGDFVADGQGCLIAGAVLSAMAAGASYAFARLGYSTNGARTGVLTAAFSSAVAMLALQVSCPDLEAVHLLVWHGATILISLAAGYGAGRLRAA